MPGHKALYDTGHPATAQGAMTNNDVMGLSYLNQRCLRIREFGSHQQSPQPEPNLLNRTQLFWDRIQVYRPWCWKMVRERAILWVGANRWPGSEVPPLLDLEILSIVR